MVIDGFDSSDHNVIGVTVDASMAIEASLCDKGDNST